MLSLILAFLFVQTISDELQQRTGQRLPEVLRQGPAVFALPPGLTFTEQLSARDAVAIALWNNAALQADLATLEISRADLVEARLFRNPSFSMLLPVGPKPFELLLAWPIEELWQRGKRIKAAELNVSAVATGLVQNGLNLIRDVRVAHTDLWMAEQRARSLRESAVLRERVAVLTARRRDAGDASGLEVRLAQVDARSTDELAQRSINEVEVFRARLRQLLGMRDDRTLFSAVPDPVDRPALPSLDALLEIAISNRPDLRAAEIDVETAAERARWQRSRILALLAPALSTKGVGTAGIRTGPGLNMDVPAFNRNQGQISRADAEVLRAGRLYMSLKDRMEEEVIESYARISQAQASVAVLREQVRPVVDESIQLTERGYQSGDLSLLNVLEATRQRFDVVLREIDAQAALQRARAELERAIGRSL
jgi:cobalt-zinc-cadmium efflux system outer membrane protein